MSMPRFLKERPTTLATSVSQPARIAGRASSTVTVVPMSASSDANSQPIAPPPITAARRRQRGEVEELVGRDDDLAVDVEAGQRPRHRAGRQDDVRALGDRRRRPRRRPPSTVPSASRRPVPEKTVTLRPFSSPERPLKSRSTISFLRFWLTEKSTVVPLVVMPNSAACSTVRRTCAVSKNSLAGTQPRCRQVPPTLSRSTMAILSPADAP